MRKFSIRFLKFAEGLFLRAHGWKSLGKDTWKPPEHYDSKRREREYRGGHAVNSQKYHLYHNPIYGNRGIKDDEDD